MFFIEKRAKGWKITITIKKLLVTIVRVNAQFNFIFYEQKTTSLIYLRQFINGCPQLPNFTLVSQLFCLDFLSISWGWNVRKCKKHESANFCSLFFFPCVILLFYSHLSFVENQWSSWALKSTWGLLSETLGLGPQHETEKKLPGQNWTRSFWTSPSTGWRSWSRSGTAGRSPPPAAGHVWIGSAQVSGGDQDLMHQVLATKLTQVIFQAI